MRNYYTVPIGVFLSIIAIINLLPLLNKANMALNILAIVGVITTMIVIVKTRVFTNFKFKNKK